jgi:TolB-like protein/tetratricopeptide (TPR) repeat protein
MTFFDELRRRNVFRVGAAYLVVAWLVLQVIDVVAPILELPDGLSKSALLLMAIGFPVAVILAWAFELTPDGVRKEKDVDRTASITQATGRTLDRIIIVVLAIAVVFFSVDKFVWTDGEPPAEEVVADVDAGLATIAVLPFVNMSADPEQEYMSDGLAEEILNLLVRIPELRVTSRASAFTFKGTDYSTEEVARELGVGHFLQGSVRRSGDRIRISTQLVDVASDSPVWSQTWERTLDDIFAIQDEVAAAVVENLHLQLLSAVPVVDRTSPDAYATYLQALSFLNQRSTDSVREAERLFLEVIDTDPDYLPAHMNLAVAYVTGAATGTWHPNEARPKAEQVTDFVLERDSDNGLALAVKAQVAAQLDFDFEAAQQYLDTALESDPNQPRVRAMLAMMSAWRGDREVAARYFEEMRAADPLSMSAHYTLGQQYVQLGQLDKAEESLRRAMLLSPGGSGVHFYLAMVYLLKGEHEAALREVELETRPGYLHTGRALIYETMGNTERATEELDAVIAIGDRWTYQIAAVHAYFNEPDEAIYWLERAVDRADTSLGMINGDPFMDNIRDDPRFIEIVGIVTGRN